MDRIDFCPDCPTRPLVDGACVCGFRGGQRERVRAIVREARAAIEAAPDGVRI